MYMSSVGEDEVVVVSRGRLHSIMELLLAFLVEKEHILMFSKVFCLKLKHLKITKLVF